MLERVIDQVQLSFAPPRPHEPVSPRSSTSSNSSTTSSSSLSSPPINRRSPSSLLFSLLTPLLTATQSASPASLPLTPVHPPARIYRRQARSLLVDTYRLYVIPAVRDNLPPAYLPWVIATESKQKISEYEDLRRNIADHLGNAGIESSSTATPLKRGRSTSASSDSDSDSDVTQSLVTPGTSVFSSGCSTPAAPRRKVPTPEDLHDTFPPAHLVPLSYRSAYVAQLTHLETLASRLSSIKKLNVRYEREESKRRWLEGLERGRAADRSLRRAFSNGLVTARVSAQPIKGSKLWRSVTAADLEREADRHAMHPSMLDSISETESCSSSAIDSDEEDEITHVELQPRRPSLVRCPIGRPTLPSKEFTDDSSITDTDDEDDECETPQLLPPPKLTSTWTPTRLAPPLPSRSTLKLSIDYLPPRVTDPESEEVNTISYDGVEVVCV